MRRLSTSMHSAPTAQRPDTTWGDKQPANLSAWGATVRGTYRVSTRGPGGKPPCASGTYPAREAGARSPYVPNGGPGGVRVS